MYKILGCYNWTNDCLIIYIEKKKRLTIDNELDIQQYQNKKCHREQL